MKFGLIAENSCRYPIVMMCRLLGVSTSGYYASRSRPESARTREDRDLRTRVVELHKASRGTYGSPRIRDDLVEEGFLVGRNRVQRLMREEGIFGVHRRKFRCLTKRDADDPVAPNELAGDFTVEAPNTAWVADITYIETTQGWLYLAVVIDLFSRSVVGWSMADTLHTQIVLDALTMAVCRRRPGSGLIHHSDRGCQYTSRAFREMLERQGTTCSMSGTGSCYDNAVAESFFATLKTECIYRTPPATKEQTRQLVFDFIENFYNRVRRHSSAGGMAPAAFERLHAARQAA